MGDTENTGREAHTAVEAAPDSWRGRVKPENEIPTAVAVNAVLAAGDDVVISLPWLTVHRNGVEFRLEIRARPGHLVPDRATDPDAAPLFEAIYSRDDVIRGNELLLGVEFADGRWCANLVRREADVNAAEVRPYLELKDGGGDHTSVTASWFLTPLPPPGDLRFVCAWIAGGVPETVTTLSADDILSAASRVRELWPVEPEPPAMVLPDSPIPAGGWFAAHTSEGLGHRPS